MQRSNLFGQLRALLDRNYLKREYIKTLWKRCLENEELHINYITPLDVEFLFNHAFRVFGDPEKAYKESLIIIEELANQI